MDPRTRRSPARFLAPLALVAVLVAFLAIVSNSGNSGNSGSGDSITTPASRTTTTNTSKKATKKKAATKAGAKTYTVQVGDTLGGIASKTGVPLQQIEELNPDVDPHAMTAGQEIKLK